MKMKWNLAFTGQDCQSTASSLKLYTLAKLTSIDSCQNGTCESHYQITNVGSNTRSDISPPLILHYNPDWNVLLTLAVNNPFIRKVAILMKFNRPFYRYGGHIE